MELIMINTLFTTSHYAQVICANRPHLPVSCADHRGNDIATAASVQISDAEGHQQPDCIPAYRTIDAPEDAAE